MQTLHDSTFEYLKPTDEQIADMAVLRTATADYAAVIDACLPPGADKTYALRKLREVGMWLNVAITRNADGSPRVQENDPDPEGTAFQQAALATDPAKTAELMDGAEEVVIDPDTPPAPAM
jgi:hypothetical protein